MGNWNSIIKKVITPYLVKKTADNITNIIKRLANDLVISKLNKF